MTTCFTRREFVSRTALFAAALPLSRWGMLPSSAITLRIGFLDGASDAARRQRQGFELGVDEAKHAAQLFGGAIETTNLAEHSSDARGLTAVIGGDDTTRCTTWSKRATADGFLFMNVGCTDDDLRGRGCLRSTFHVIPSDAMYRDARAMAGNTPGETTAWSSSLSRFGADTLNQRFQTRFNQSMTADAWAAWLAVKILWESALRQRSGDVPALATFLERDSTQFDGHKGQPLSFRPWDHQLRQPVYLIAAGHGVKELPEGSPESSVRDVLDRLGASSTSTTCRFAR
jgi:ABC-type branched-subunit amino acid transport system substrate-binding protein